MSEIQEYTNSVVRNRSCTPAGNLLDIPQESVPFDLELQGLKDGMAVLHCKDVLRLLPGRRIVFSGSWEGRSVVAKVYVGKHSMRDRRAEEIGVTRLEKAGILTPALLYSGKLTDNNAEVLLFEQITDAVSLKDVWAQEIESEHRRNLLTRAVRLLAQHHNRGIQQTDLHLHNFLVCDDKIYTIDTSHVVARRGQVRLGKAIDNLAMLLSQMYVEDDNIHAALFAEYERQRGLVHRDRNFIRLKRMMHRWRRRLEKNLYNKIFRECTAYAYISHQGGRIICRRGSFTEGMRAFLENIDNRFEPACRRYLKQGRSSTVCMAEVDGRRLVLKRYNDKGIYHRFRRALRTSRAARSWLSAHALAFYGIPTAKPVALVESSRLLPGLSYFISEYVDGDNAWNYFNNQKKSSDELSRTAAQIDRIIKRLGEASMAHGDLKATNFVISGDGPVLMDLDALVQYRLKYRARQAHAADVRRFMQNWSADPVVEELFANLHHG